MDFNSYVWYGMLVAHEKARQTHKNRQEDLCPYPGAGGSIHCESHVENA